MFDKLHRQGVLHVVLLHANTNMLAQDLGCFTSDAAVRYFVEERFSEVGNGYTIQPCCADLNHLGWVISNDDGDEYHIRADAIELYTMKESLH